MRTYHDIALSLTLLLFAVAIWQTAKIPQPIAYLLGHVPLTGGEVATVRFELPIKDL